MLNYLKIFIFAFASTYLLTPLVKVIAEKSGAIDVPKDNRRMHKKPIPLLGGLAIYGGFLFATLLFMRPLSKEFQAIVFGSAVIVISGYFDDTKGLSPSLKIIFQLIAAFIAVYGGLYVDSFSNLLGEKGSTIGLGILSYPFTILWIVGVTNAVNLIDGMDGLADGISLIAAVSLAITSFLFGNSQVGTMFLILAGACLGFLPYNFNPAKIFMGDTGALLLGYLFSVLTIEGVMKTAATVAIVVPILVLAVPISDTLFAIVRRTLSGQSFAVADKGHLHHKILARGYTVKQTVLILYMMAGLLGILAILVSLIGGLYGNLLALGIIILIIVGAKRIGIFQADDKKVNQKKEKK